MPRKKISTRNLFFWKSFVKTFVLIMLPIVIISAYSLYRLQENSEQAIEARNHNLLLQIMTEADSIFHTVDTVSEFLTGSTSVNYSLPEIFLSRMPSSQSMKQANTLAQYLQGIIQSNEYAYRAYLYYDNPFGRYIAATPSNAYMKSYSSDRQMDAFLDSPSDFWYESRNLGVYSFSPEKEVLAIYQKLYSPYSAELSAGVLVTYFDMSLFREYLSNFSLYPEQTILFLQEGQPPLFQSSDRDYSGLTEQLLPQVNPDSISRPFHMKYEGVSYLVSLTASSRSGLYFVSLIPDRVFFRQVHSMTAVFLLIAAAACILSIFLSLYRAGKECDQLQVFIDVFNDADAAVSSRILTSSKTSDPYQAILRNIINLFLEQDYLKLQLDNKQYQIQLLELQALQHQINPHFLFNTLNTIYWKAVRLTSGPNICSSMISSLSEILSYSLTDAQKKVPLRMELEYLEHYTDIQQIRYDHKFEVVWDIDEDALDLPILKMTLQPLVENSIYHGIKEKEESGLIKIRVYCRPGRVIIRILDNGAGIPEERLAEIKRQLASSNTGKPEAHIGLFNTNRRLILAYGEPSAIRIYSLRDIGTIVSFTIPSNERL